jgi:branched-chain amino acid transport system substrate-binding protein
VRRAGLAAVLVLLAAGCGGHSSAAPHAKLTVVVDAPFTGTPYVGETIDRGVSLAVSDVNARGGVTIGAANYDLRVERLDSALSPRRAVANTRKAVDDHAIAIVDEGTGLDATWKIAQRAGIPICVVYEGGEKLVDPQARPNVFRIAPTNHGIAFRLAEYLARRHLRPAILHDDSDYGAGGETSLRKAFAYDPKAVAADIAVPAGALDLAAQVLRARRAHATALLVWGLPSTIASAVTAARTAGWNVPVFTPPSGADPLVRQQLADHPSWIDGLTFASGRLTAEAGPGFFDSFQSRFESAYGAEKVGVKTHEGRPVVQPPEFAMYGYDFVQVLAAAIQTAHSSDPAKVTAALNQVSVRGVNGDERGFNEHNHEGVVDDDVYFARFHDMTFAPVKDDPLSGTLPTIVQTR